MLIHKATLYARNIGSTQSAPVPKTAKILSVQPQNGSITIWYSFTKAEKKATSRKFLVAYTGQEFKVSSKSVFLGTVQIGDLVHHVYEVK